MERKTYNGWTNYETWAVNLWLTNEEWSEKYWRGEADTLFEQACSANHQTFTPSEHARFMLADQLKEEISANVPDALDGTMFSDLIGAALSEVDWSEIANAFLEECETADGTKYEYAKDGAE